MAEIFSPKLKERYPWNSAYTVTWGVGRMAHDRSPLAESRASPSSCYSTDGIETRSIPWKSFNGNDNGHRYLRKRCAILCHAFNSQPLSVSLEERSKAWHELTDPEHIASEILEEAPLVRSPFWIDYGLKVRVAPSAFIDRNCYIQDNPMNVVSIGDGSWIGPGVHICSVKHDTDWRNRNGIHGPALGAPVVVGEDCFIGSHAVILPGVTLGNGCVIGAGSIVTRSIPPYHVAFGNPAKVIRKVSLNVPDAPGLDYEQNGDRAMVIQRLASHQPLIKRFALQTTFPREQVSFSREYQVVNSGDSKDKPALIRMVESIEPGNPGIVGVDVVLLIVALIGAWLIMHILLY